MPGENSGGGERAYRPGYGEERKTIRGEKLMPASLLNPGAAQDRSKRTMVGADVEFAVSLPGKLGDSKRLLQSYTGHGG